MATRKLGLTRDQLADFLKTHDQIRQFELLFSEVNEASSSSSSALIDSDNAMLAANQAVGQIGALSQDAGVSSAYLESRITSASDRAELTNAETSSTLALLASRVAQLDALLDSVRKDVDGVQMAPPPKEPKRTRYGQFYDTTTQVAAVINTATAITYNTTNMSSGVFLRPGNSEIQVDTEGVYDFQFSVQLDKTSGGTELFWIWPRLNGSDIPDSASQIRIQGNDAEILCSANLFIDMKAGDYAQFMFAVSDLSVELKSFAASAFAPSVPSIIVTVSNNIRT